MRKRKEMTPAQKLKNAIKSRKWRHAHPIAARISNRRQYNKHTALMRQVLRDLKANPCEDCHQSFPPCVMDFDHIRGKKRRNIGQLLKNSLGVLLAEIEKCELVCANCHRIRTSKPRDYIESKD
jgi:hypothetical protein